MKYAKIQKSPTSWPVLVRFPDTVTRAEQWLRFGYEYPEGTWENMGYYQARIEGYSMRHWTDGKAKTIELCGGRTFPAVLKAEAYAAIEEAESAAALSDIRSAGDYWENGAFRVATGDLDEARRIIWESICETMGLDENDNMVPYSAPRMIHADADHETNMDVVSKLKSYLDFEREYRQRLYSHLQELETPDDIDDHAVLRMIDEVIKAVEDRIDAMEAETWQG